MMKFLKNKRNNKKGAGFTLIELLVAIAIFIIVISVIFSLFLSALKGQRRAIASQNVQDNARFLLEFIAKELRTSDIDIVTSSGLDIINQEGISVFYRFEGGDIKRAENNLNNLEPINSEEVTVTGRFNVEGLGSSDTYQPRITIAMKVETTIPDNAEINIQTTLSPRNLEIPN